MHKAAALRCNGRWQAASSSDLPQRCVAARGQDFASPFLFPLLFVFNHNRIVVTKPANTATLHRLLLTSAGFVLLQSFLMEKIVKFKWVRGFRYEDVVPPRYFHLPAVEGQKERKWSCDSQDVFPDSSQSIPWGEVL